MSLIGTKANEFVHKNENITLKPNTFLSCVLWKPRKHIIGSFMCYSHEQLPLSHISTAQFSPGQSSFTPVLQFRSFVTIPIPHVTEQAFEDHSDHAETSRILVGMSMTLGQSIVFRQNDILQCLKSLILKIFFNLGKWGKLQFDKISIG